MDDRQPPPPRNSSRTLAMIAVAVLVVIAIAGIVLATLRPRGAPADTPVAADATQTAASAMTSDSAAAEAEAAAGPNQVVFAPASDQLSEPASLKLLRIAATAKKEKKTVLIASQIEARADRASQMELAQKRAIAVRGVLEANGVALGAMQIQIAEVPLGLVSKSDANRVDVALR